MPTRYNRIMPDTINASEAATIVVPREVILNKRRVEQFALIAGIIQPLLTIPQIYTIYSSHSATDVSLVTWAGYLIFGVVFLVYGAVFKLKPIFYGQIIWVSAQLLTVIGILVYG